MSAFGAHIQDSKNKGQEPSTYALGQLNPNGYGLASHTRVIKVGNQGGIACVQTMRICVASGDNMRMYMHIGVCSCATFCHSLLMHS